MSSTRRNLSLSLTLAVALLLVAGAAAAQEKVRFGVKGGLTLSELHGDLLPLAGIMPEFVVRPGFAVGGFVEIPFSGVVILQPEVMYQRRETEFVPPAVIGPDFAESEFTFTMSYLEIPVLLKCRLGDRELQSFIAGGPSVALNLESESFTRFGGFEGTTDLENDTADLDLGVALGAGLELGGKVTVEVRYTYGLTSTGIAGPNARKWRTLLVAVGYVF